MGSLRTLRKKEPMPPVRYLYADSDDAFLAVTDYGPILDSLGDILLRRDDEDCNLFLYKKSGKYGVLTFTWDNVNKYPIYKCRSWDAVQKVYDQIAKEVIWFDSARSCFVYLERLLLKPSTRIVEYFRFAAMQRLRQEML
jgi:hypothetical protein